MALYNAGTDTVLGGKEPVFAGIAAVTRDFFRVFGVGPEIGRTFVDEEMRPGGVPAVIVGHHFWEQTLGGQRDLSQVRVMVEGVSARVVGVMPASFDYPANTDLWYPRELEQDTSGRTSHGKSVVARLKPDVPLTRAAADVNAIAVQLKAQYGDDDNAIGTTTMRLQDALAMNSRPALLLLLAAVGLVLLIACANVAASLLARSEERRRELAVRAAIGAGRGRLIRQMLVECLVLGLIGAGAGLLLAGWIARVMGSFDGSALPAYARIAIDARVLVFTTTLGILTPLLFGLVPALQASKPDLRDTLAEGGRQGAAPGRAGMRSTLVAAEVAFALLLLVGAGLLIRSFSNVMSVNPGFDPRGAIAAEMAVPGMRYTTPEAAVRFYDELLQRLRAVPGVSAAGATNQLPLNGVDFGGAFRFIGTEDPNAVGTNEYDGFKYSAGYRVVTPGYFEALGERLVRGRAIEEEDRPGQPPVAVVNETFVRRFLPSTNPIGVRFAYAGMDPVNPEFTIVGVAADVHHRALVDASQPEVFVPLAQAPFRARYNITVVARADRPAQQAAVAQAVRTVVRQLDPDVPITMTSLEQVMANSVADRRFTLLVLATFAAMALLLAATGIYSVLSQIVAQRTQEIGIRMALGADGGTVVRLMLGNALVPVAAGIAAGAIGSAFAVRLLASFLFGVQPLDPMAFAAAAALLAGVAALAGYVPARRATRVDPLLALRQA